MTTHLPRVVTLGRELPLGLVHGPVLLVLQGAPLAAAASWPGSGLPCNLRCLLPLPTSGCSSIILLFLILAPGLLVRYLPSASKAFPANE